MQAVLVAVAALVVGGAVGKMSTGEPSLAGGGVDGDRKAVTIPKPEDVIW